MREYLRRRLDPDERFGLRLSLLAIAFLLVAVPFGILLVQVLGEGPLTRIDTSAANHLHDWVRRWPWLVSVLEVITALGSTLWLTAVVVGVTVHLVRAHRGRAAVFLVTTTALGGLLITLIKAAVDRPRPSLVGPVATASGQSFPSGHAMGASFVYGAVLVVLASRLSPPRRRAAICIGGVLVLAIGFTRLALGVHYITDVAAGIVLGLAWLAAAAAAFALWREERRG